MSLQAYDATPKQIKSRYYEVMREIHPDLSDEAEQELAHELATFLNHVYEVRTGVRALIVLHQLYLQNCCRQRLLLSMEPNVTAAMDAMDELYWL